MSQMDIAKHLVLKVMNKEFIKCDIKNFIKNSIYRLRCTYHRAKRRNVYYCVFETHKKHAGLADRLKTVILQYDLAKASGYEFKLFWKTPFCLSEYLKPKTDWECSLDDLEYSLLDTKIISEVSWRQRKLLKPGKQYHCYRYSGGGQSPKILPFTGLKWVDLFNELFEPSDRLRKAYKTLGIPEHSYVAVHIRFVNALEKFENTYFDNHIDSEEKRKELIERCKKGIMDIVDENQDKDVYVFSDSKVFLDSIEGLPVKVLDHDEVCHVSENSNSDTQLKSFLDMYVISKASAVYRFQAPELLSLSGFSKVASNIGDIPFFNKNV